jgi:hypothetical protein
VDRARSQDEPVRFAWRPIAGKDAPTPVDPQKTRATEPTLSLFYLAYREHDWPPLHQAIAAGPGIADRVAAACVRAT